MSRLQAASTMRVSVSFVIAAIGSGCSGTGGSSASTPTTSETASQVDEGVAERARIEQYIVALHAPADIQHTFKTEQGETIDCVDYYSQPSVKAKLAAGKSMQDVAPLGLSDVVRLFKDRAPDFAAIASRALAAPSSQDESGSRRECPTGTVPSLRPTVEQIVGMGGLDAYRLHALKHPRSPQPKVNNTPTTEVPGYMHVEGEYLNHSINGGVTSTSVYAPNGSTSAFVHSLSQFWFWAGSNQSTCTSQCTSNCQQTVEAGWEVEPSFFTTPSGQPDSNPHLFVFTTPDGYWTNCEDGQQCATANGLPSASQPWSTMSGNWAPGQALTPSGPGTTPPQEIELATAGYGSEWLVIVQSINNTNNTLIGEYSSSFYHGGPLANIATQSNITASFAVGGEVEWDDSMSLVPVDLAMGDPASYLLPISSPYGTAAYHRNVGLLIYEYGLGELTPAFDTFFQADSNCYNLQQSQPGSSSWGNYFYFGGLGQVCFGSQCNACCNSSDSACTAIQAAETAALTNGCVN
jgi:hypothetical protein